MLTSIPSLFSFAVFKVKEIFWFVKVLQEKKSSPKGFHSSLSRVASFSHSSCDGFAQYIFLCLYCLGKLEQIMSFV